MCSACLRIGLGTRQQGAQLKGNVRRNEATRPATASDLKDARFEAMCETNCFLNTHFETIR